MPPVIALDWLSPDIFELHLEKDGLEYQAGDCTLLIGPDGVDSRPYSFSSHPSQNRLSFLIRLVPAGGLTPWLATRKPGDWVETSSPFGLFAPGREGPAVFIATGTGVAPFLSWLRSPEAPVPRAFFYGVRKRENAVFHDWLRDRLGFGCTYRMLVSGEGEGRVTDLSDTLPLGPDLHYYLCGHESMSRDMTARLQALGVPDFRIHSEVFFPG